VKKTFEGFASVLLGGGLLSGIFYTLTTFNSLIAIS